MSESVRMWVEVSFNVAYLIAVWTIVGAMWRRRSIVAVADRRVAGLLTAAFALLAFGDTGHVGFRVVAYASGGLDTTVPLLGVSVGLVGVGALATAITVTLFYVLALAIWRERFGRRYGHFGAVLLAAAVVRFAVMLSPANDWSAIVPPLDWSLYRNVPLVVQGLGVAFLILRDAGGARDRTFTTIGALILVSYACYAPVILFVQQAPLIGMLMIPKTLAYLGIAIVGYRALYRDPGAATAPEHP